MLMSKAIKIIYNAFSFLRVNILRKLVKIKDDMFDATVFSSQIYVNLVDATTKREGKNHAKNSVKLTHVINSYLCFRRGLHEGAVVELSGKIESLVFAHDTLLLQITLVSDQHHGYVICVLKRQ